MGPRPSDRCVEKGRQMFDPDRWSLAHRGARIEGISMRVGRTSNTRGLFGNAELGLNMYGHLLAPLLEILLNMDQVVLSILPNSSNAGQGSLPAVSVS